MTAPISLLTPLTGSVLPAANPQGLSDDEQRLITGLATKLTVQSTYVRTRYLYYDGEQRLSNLGISVPSVLAGVRTVVDWPRICVDRLVERVELDGFRLPQSTEVDDELRAFCEANDFAAELPLAVQDSLVAGRGFMIVGSPDVPGDAPVVTVESPLNMTLEWDPRTRRVLAGYQSYEVEGKFKAALYLPDQTIYMGRDEQSGWVIENRDVHLFGEVPVVRFANRSRASDREGRSEITPAVMATTDSACRSLLGMEIAREVYSIPHLAILGASEADFVGADGTAKRALDMAMTQVLAFERDAEGQLPTLQQLKAFDPSVFTKIINAGAQLMSSYTGFPPAYFGETTTANPASADAIRVGLDGLDRGAGRVVRQVNAPVRKLGQLMWRTAHNGAELPAELAALQPDWTDTRTATPAADADALFKQVSMGAVPAWSDVVLKRLGYDAVERARLAQDRKLDPDEALLAELANRLGAKLARTDKAVLNDLTDPAVAGAVATPEPPAAPPAR